MQPIEVQAKTVEEAIKIACRQLNADENQLLIETIEGTPGMLRSIFSGKKARIRVQLAVSTATAAPCQDSPAPAAATAQAPPDAEEVEHLREILEKIVQRLQDTATVSVAAHDGEVTFQIHSTGSGLFIGKRGQTLEAFQYLLNKIRMNKFRGLPPVNVDSEAYRSRHVDSLKNLAMRLSDKAKKRGGPVTTNPLSAGDRRIIHMTLKKDPELTTWSKGEGAMKKVIIAPRTSGNA